MSSHWNYRILARRVNNEIEYEFYEVHYENDIAHACTMNSVSPYASSEDDDSVESIKWQLDAMKLACSKKILDYDRFPQEYLPYYRKKKLEAIEKLIQ